MNPGIVEGLFEVAIFALRAVNQAQHDNETSGVRVELKRRLRAEMSLMSETLDRDIAAERERGRAEWVE